MFRLPSRRGFGRFDVLVLTSLLWFLAKFLRYAFPPLFGSLRDAYGVSNATIGTAFTGFMLAYAAMQFPAGLLADRFGSARVITAGAVVAVGAALAVVVESPFAVLVLAMVVMGAGTGVHKTVAVELLARTYPARTGRVLGVFDTFGTFGGVAAPVAVVLFTGLPGVLGDGWRTLFLAAVAFGVVLVVLFRTRVTGRGRRDDGAADADQAPQDGDADDTATDDASDTATNDADDTATDDAGATVDGGTSSVLRTYAVLFRDRRFAAFVAVTILFGFTYNGVVAFLPLYLTEEAGLSPTTTGAVYSALFAASLVQLVTGEASDRFGTRPVVVLTLALATTALTALVALSGVAGPLWIGAAVVCLGVGGHGFRPVRGAHLMSLVPDSIAGGGFGAVRTLLMGAGAVAPAVVGYLSETVGFRAAFSLLAASVAGATALSLLLFVVYRR